MSWRSRDVGGVITGLQFNGPCGVPSAGIVNANIAHVEQNQLLQQDNGLNDCLNRAKNSFAEDTPKRKVTFYRGKVIFENLKIPISPETHAKKEIIFLS